LNRILHSAQKGYKTLNTRLLYVFVVLSLYSVVGVWSCQTLFREPQQLHVPSPSVPDEYRLVFFDEFENQGLDSAHWRHRYSVGNEYGAGIASYSSVSQPGDGLLHLVTRYEDEQFLTGMIRSIPQFQYGYFEARIRFQTLQGHHGAFWLQSESYGQITGDPGQSGAEIDIIEFFGNGRVATDAKQNVYFDPYISRQEQPGAEHDLFYRDDQVGVELSEEFHVFGLLWTLEEYVFFIEGVETWRTSVGMSHVQQYIVLSLTTFAWENARLDTTLLPDEMLVDYVRIYQKPR
jgi:hypothetical protein